jgi:hypothetical protein
MHPSKQLKHAVSEHNGREEGNERRAGESGATCVYTRAFNSSSCQQVLRLLQLSVSRLAFALKLHHGRLPRRAPENEPHAVIKHSALRQRHVQQTLRSDGHTRQRVLQMFGGPDQAQPQRVAVADDDFWAALVLYQSSEQLNRGAQALMHSTLLSTGRCRNRRPCLHTREKQGDSFCNVWHHDHLRRFKPGPNALRVTRKHGRVPVNVKTRSNCHHGGRNIKGGGIGLRFLFIS